MEIKHFALGYGRTNCYLVYDPESKKAFILDPGEESQSLLDFIRENELEPEYIVLTHGHGDHFGGVPSLREAFPGIRVVCSEADRFLLEDKDHNFTRDFCRSGKMTLEADVWIKDGDHLQVGPMDLEFIATPGHTPGGMSVYLEDVVFCGDTLFFHSMGRSDFPGSSTEALYDSIRERLYKLPPETRCLPGHMGFTTIGEEMKNNPFVSI